MHGSAPYGLHDRHGKQFNHPGALGSRHGRRGALVSRLNEPGPRLIEVGPIRSSVSLKLAQDVRCLMEVGPLVARRTPGPQSAGWSHGTLRRARRASSAVRQRRCEPDRKDHPGDEDDMHQSAEKHRTRLRDPG